MAVERQCEWCGEKFYIPPSKVKLGRGRFCSRICYEKWQKDGGVTKACEWCGKEFYVGPYRAKKGLGRFCSPACYGKWQSENMCGENSQNWNGGKVKKTCEICKKEFKVVPSREDEARYCSLACRGKWQSENRRGENSPVWKERIKKVCEQCGKEIYVLPRTVKKGWGQFCDRACQARWQSENARGENSQNWQGGRDKLICEQCGEEFEAYLAEKRRFCSMECKGLWQSENMCGENHWNWRGGISSEPYGPEWTEDLKEDIRRRDNYTCAISGEVWQIGQDKFPVHHCDYDKTNNDLDNLITLSKSSHSRTNTNRHHWQALLTHIAKGAEMCVNAFVDGI